MEIDYNKLITIDERDSDDKVIWDLGSSIDGLAKQYYGSESYWKIIMIANPKYSLPFDIPNGEVIRIPLPLDAVIEEISIKSETYKN